MSYFKPQVVTNEGKNLFARALTENKALLFTKVALGSGTPFGDIEYFNELVNEELEGVLIDSNNLLSTAELVVLFTNEEVETEFEIRELGIFAKLEGDTESILYSYSEAVDLSIMPDKSLPVTLKWNLYFNINNGSDISLSVESSLQMLNKETADTLYESIFEKKSGFNRVISDSVTTVSSIIVASSSAVKTAYNKAVKAYDLANAKENSFNKNNAFNKTFGTISGSVAQGNDSRIVNAVPKTRKINNKSLTKNITLSSHDVGALEKSETAVNSDKLGNKSANLYQLKSDVVKSYYSYETSHGNKGSSNMTINSSLKVTITNNNIYSILAQASYSNSNRVVEIKINGIVRASQVRSSSGDTGTNWSVYLVTDLKEGDTVEITGTATPNQFIIHSI